MNNTYIPVDTGRGEQGAVAVPHGSLSGLTDIASHPVYYELILKLRTQIDELNKRIDDNDKVLNAIIKKVGIKNYNALLRSK